MTKKYEKFEEWMVGKAVTWDGDKGVVIKDFKDDCVWVLWEDGGELWIEIDSLVFLDEAPPQSDENKPIDWQVGQVVWDVVYGKGVVNCVEEDDFFPVKVEFDDGGSESYTLQGSFYESGTRTLFFSEPTITADTMPPEKPFVPTLEEGDEVVVCRACGTIELHTVLKETEYVLHTEDLDLEKSKIKVFKLGEEIKWEN